jgi:hypothetical protein
MERYSATKITAQESELLKVYKRLWNGMAQKMKKPNSCLKLLIIKIMVEATKNNTSTSEEIVKNLRKYDEVTSDRLGELLFNDKHEKNSEMAGALQGFCVLPKAEPYS